ncbi:hypothetical protein NHX12_001229 [Muraenolepis orangiensis]|uniref:Peptidase M12B domain-containing protein n=1 Tax=Muraenolepis orangiensis TaxID=630683 RepID=A0A9Q0DZH7_9TELE|nr:hypothetical protein NHX12_001229 [Muraenolepis orangiensis]
MPRTVRVFVRWMETREELSALENRVSAAGAGHQAAPVEASTVLHSLNLPQNTEYEIVAPYEVDHRGRLLSHQVSHQQRRRRRRSLQPDASPDAADASAADASAADASAADGGGGETVHFRLSGLGQDFHMELREASAELIAPGFTVQVLGKHGAGPLRDYRHRGDLCFYQGSLRFKVNSSVALSTCAGMTLTEPHCAQERFDPDAGRGLLLEARVPRPGPEGELQRTPQSSATHPLQEHRGQEPSDEQRKPGGPSGEETHVLSKRSTGLQPPRHPARSEELMVNNSSAAGNRGDGMGHRGDHQGDHHHGDDYNRGEKQKQHFCGRRKKYMPKPLEGDSFILPDEYAFAPRSKREVMMKNQPGDQKLNVETLVVVDKKMMENHGHENITTYVLTVLNMVSSLFKDGTIGGNINIAIVGLVLLAEEQEGLVINHHADHTLNSFCQWQSGLGGRGGRRHDHAVLLTGLDICSWKNEPCDTLGFAPINGMCSKYRSCTINEDTGLGLAFTIAHESGHNFGMVHDGEGNVCKKSEGNIMSPTLAGHNGVFSWSQCSRQYLSRFLKLPVVTYRADNEPRAVEEYQYPEKLPGELYDADTQCKWQFGEKAKLCTLDFKKDICKALWCHRVGRKCETKFMPAAEGSSCGPDMWCRRGQCVKQGDEGPRPQHGGWSSWTSWSTCSRSCESGVTHRERQCSNPRPAFGGKYCDGSSRSYKLCNTGDCPSGGPSYRAQQCAEHNDQDLCKLYCFAEGYDFFFALASKVKDGTICSQDTSNVCIDGVCEKVGCDRVLGSKAVPDMCGLCNGDNSTCKVYKGQFTKQHYANQYYGVVTIPAGARSIRVVELNSSSSYLAVRDTQRRYHLNGRWTVDWPGRHPMAGALFEYKRPYNRPESLTSTGPTNQTLVVEVLIQGWNPGVRWEYTLKKADDKRVSVKHNYTWAIVRSQCSATCAGGQMHTKPACYKDLRVQVNTSHCSAKSRPATGPMPCNTQPCPASWSVGEWGVCSRSCGGGEQTRQVQCVQRTSQSHLDTLADPHCVQPSPGRRQACNAHTCPPVWSPGPWSQCSRLCGKGLRKRTVLCTSWSPSGRSQDLVDSSCATTHKPTGQESCFVKRCPKQRKVQWFVSTWQQCSVTCGRGSQTRFIKCAEKDTAGKYKELAAKKCHHVPKPAVELQRPCAQAACPPARTTPPGHHPWNPLYGVVRWRCPDPSGPVSGPGEACLWVSSSHQAQLLPGL